MAEFEVCELEGMRWVQIRLRDETVRAEAGALSHMQGDISVRVRLPSPLGALKSIISNEALVRPSYTGTGVINLNSSMGGYYPFEVTGESSILENGAYWASDGGVELGLHRERVWTSFWGGEGFIDYQTMVSGSGRVVLNAPRAGRGGHPEERPSARGGQAGARPHRRRRLPQASRDALVPSLLSGEPVMRLYQGTGKALVCWTPYWNQQIARMMAR